MFDISVDQFFYTEGHKGEGSCRKSIDVMLNSMNEKELVVMKATAEGLKKARETEVSAAAPVGAGRAPLAHSTPKPGFGPTWSEESASLRSLCWLNVIKIAEVHYNPLLFLY
jgi:hypothetical protein